MVYDPAQREQENSRLNQYLTERLAFKQILTPKTKESMSALIRTHPTLSANVVTAVGPEGFFLQTPPERDDGNPDTSNGIYVVYATEGPAVVPTGRVSSRAALP